MTRGVDIELLERHVRELRDRQEIADVLYNYMDCADRYDFDRMAETCFHEDGVFVSEQQRGSDPVPIREFFDWCRAPNGPVTGFIQTMHYLMNMMIKLNGDEALAQSHILVQHMISKDAPDLPLFPNLGKDYGLLGGSRYLDRFERRNGRWAISRRELQMEWNTQVAPSTRQGLLASFGKLVPSEFQDYMPETRP